MSPAGVTSAQSGGRAREDHAASGGSVSRTAG